MKAPPKARIPSLAAFKARVDKQLRAIFGAALTEASEIDYSYSRLIEQLQDQTLRAGKRLRPYVAFVAYAGSGGRDTDGFLPVAASLELVHQFLLAHDDIIDRDFIRYGGPNIAGHYVQQFTEMGLPRSDALQYGSSYALLAGDSAWNLAHKSILGSGFSAAKKLRAIETLEAMLFEVLGGQLLDVQNGVPGSVPASSEGIIGVGRHKTASYTFQGPLEVGALLAGAPAQLRAQLREYGAAVGTAFQLADDILGVYGDEQALGKSVLSDMREGKQTLLLYFAYRGATPGQGKTLSRIWGKRAAGEPELVTVREILEVTGALKKSTALAEQKIAEALAVIERTTLSTAARAELVRLASFSLSRKN
jgi:geranylgeranyl diphosphate synthase type II